MNIKWGGKEFFALPTPNHSPVQICRSSRCLVLLASPSLMLIYSWMLMTLMLLCLCVCLAGQTRRRSEEEQGDEGGSLPVDERRRRRARKSRTRVFWVGKKKKGMKQCREEKKNNEGENNNYVDGVTLKGNGLISQTRRRVCMGKSGEVTHFSLFTDEIRALLRKRFKSLSA